MESHLTLPWIQMYPYTVDPDMVEYIVDPDTVDPESILPPPYDRFQKDYVSDMALRHDFRLQ